MKYLILAVIVMSIACPGAIAAEKAQGNVPDPAGKTVVFEEAGGPGEKAIDTGDTRQGEDDDGGVDDSGRTPQYETYDPNTGLPDKVPSDAYGEFD